MATVIDGHESASRDRASRDVRKQTRARIIDTTLELIASRGFAATSTREISERLGFTKAALYYHFRTKDDLLAAIVEPFARELASLLADAKIESPLSPSAKRRVLERYLDHLLTHAEIVGVLADDPGVRTSAPMQAASRLFELLVSALVGSTDDAGQRLRAWAAFGALHSGVRHARPHDASNTVRESVLAAACGALGIPVGRRPGARNGSQEVGARAGLKAS